MRTVKIEYGGKLIAGNGGSVLCPMKTTGYDSYACTPQCAWFSITTDKDNDNPDIWKAQYACCKDHRIGKIETDTPKAATETKSPEATGWA